MSHLKIKKVTKESIEESIKNFDGLESWICPAKVYEYIETEKGNKVLQINY